MASGQEFEKEFGDNLIKNFQDLMRLETTQRDAKINQLMDELNKYESQEKSKT